MNDLKDQQKILRRFKIDASSFGEIFQNPLNFFVNSEHLLEFFKKSEAIKYMPSDLDEEFELGEIQVRFVSGKNCTLFVENADAVLYKCTGTIYNSTVWGWECSLLLQGSWAKLWQSDIQSI
jgi:RNA recognition motif-containing protein